ncbi:hypothetical protein KSP40_PGU021356 [Platanthera guangdongensis]|uniref:Uncharacterized protein n=1 Tax=Platanthera guangdongensis TaxID=2320717 RepID=A0ABR2N2N3_9ASPA
MTARLGDDANPNNIKKISIPLPKKSKKHYESKNESEADKERKMTFRADSHRLVAIESSSASRTALGQRLLNLDDPAFLSMPRTAASVLKILESSSFDFCGKPSKRAASLQRQRKETAFSPPARQ